LAKLVTTQYLVDGLNRQTVTIDPEGGEATTFYDLAGNVTGTQDKNGNLSAYLFDALNRQTVTVSPVHAHRTTSTLDPLNNVVQPRSSGR
jgi:hypothetical protein